MNIFLRSYRPGQGKSFPSGGGFSRRPGCSWGGQRLSRSGALMPLAARLINTGAVTEILQQDEKNPRKGFYKVEGTEKRGWIPNLMRIFLSVILLKIN